MKQLSKNGSFGSFSRYTNTSSGLRAAASEKTIEKGEKSAILNKQPGFERDFQNNRSKIFESSSKKQVWIFWLLHLNKIFQSWRKYESGNKHRKKKRLELAFLFLLSKLADRCTGKSHPGRQDPFLRRTGCLS